MAKSRFGAGFLGAVAGVYAVYLLIVVARAGFETGRMLAGRATPGDVVAVIDIPATLLLASGLVLFLVLRKAPRG